MLKKLTVFLFTLLFIITVPLFVNAGDTATQNLNLIVEAINEISLSQSSVDLLVTASEAGLMPDRVIDSTTTMAYSTNETNRKITAQLDKALPNGIYMLLEVTTNDATSAGEVSLTSDPVDIITGISNVAESGKTVTYQVNADMNAAPVTDIFEVTYTITGTI